MMMNGLAMRKWVRNSSAPLTLKQPALDGQVPIATYPD